LVFEPDFAAHFFAPGNAKFFGYTAGNGKRGYPPGLGAPNLRLNPQTGFQTHLGQLRGFPRASLSSDDNSRVLSNELNNLPGASSDGEFGWISDLRQSLATKLAELHRAACGGDEPVQDCLVGCGVVLIAQGANKARAQSQPIGSHRPRQQLAYLFYAGISHPGGKG
jgi:hypothetical protein